MVPNNAKHHIHYLLPSNCGFCVTPTLLLWGYTLKLFQAPVNLIDWSFLYYLRYYRFLIVAITMLCRVIKNHKIMCINVLAVCKTASTMPKNNDDSLLVINTAWTVSNTELFLVHISCFRTEYGVVTSGAQGHSIERVVR